MIMLCKCAKDLYRHKFITTERLVITRYSYLYESTRVQVCPVEVECMKDPYSSMDLTQYEFNCDEYCNWECSQIHIMSRVRSQINHGNLVSDGIIWMSKCNWNYSLYDNDILMCSRSMHVFIFTLRAFFLASICIPAEFVHYIPSSFHYQKPIVAICDFSVFSYKYESIFFGRILSVHLHCVAKFIEATLDFLFQWMN